MLRNDPRYINSRKIAFQTALNDRLVRQEFSDYISTKGTFGRLCHTGGLYRLFNTTLVFGIMALLETDQARATEYRGFLEEFLENHKTETDLCSQRELQIIGLFLAKARSPLTVLSKHQVHTSAPKAMNDEINAGNSSAEDTWTPGEQDTAQSLLNHLGGFGHSTQFNVPNMVLDSQSSMQDPRFPYGPMPLSFDVNRLDLNHVNSFFGTEEVPESILPTTPMMANLAHGETTGMGTDIGDMWMRQPTLVPANAEFRAGDQSETPQQGMLGTVPSSGIQSPDLLLTPWTGLIDAIVPMHG